ncbi:MAG: SPOR domain-containing protein, partial [Burkholderiales bacterium]|nr:SPOR domain-containing protein [Burkholderiales bacterium]
LGCGGAQAADPAASAQPALAPLTSPAAAAPPASAADDGNPHLGHIDLPRLRPQISLNAKLGQAEPPPPPAPAAAPERAPKRPSERPSERAATARAGGARAPAAAWALVTPPLGSRAAMEPIKTAVAAQLRAAGIAPRRVDAMQAGAAWRVVGWPFTSRAQAEKAKTLLALRGLDLEIVEF